VAVAVAVAVAANADARRSHAMRCCRPNGTSLTESGAKVARSQQLREEVFLFSLAFDLQTALLLIHPNV
jgi:hypothetical protein